MEFSFEKRAYTKLIVKLYSKESQGEKLAKELTQESAD